MLKKNVIQSVLGLSALLAVMAAQGQATSTDYGKPPTATQDSSAQAATSATLGASDQKILKNLAMENMAEIDAARMVQTKSDNDAIRKFAQQMIDDHGKVLDDVKQLAQARGVALPEVLDRSHQAKADKLAALSGAAFERAYLARAGVADHQKSHKLLQAVLSQAMDADLKALVERTMPVVEQHLTAVRQLNRDTARGSSKTQGDTGVSPDKK
ncbi:MAG: DUF4142 domain-containing protein [Pseudomonadota bacterium]